MVCKLMICLMLVFPDHKLYNCPVQSTSSEFDTACHITLSKQHLCRTDIQLFFKRQKIGIQGYSKKKNLFFFFLAVLGLRCCVKAFPSCGEQGLLFVAVHGLLIAVASLVVDHRLQARGLQQLQHAGPRVRGLQQLWRMGSGVVVHRLSCSVACGIFPDQGLNLCPLHWLVDS